MNSSRSLQPCVKLWASGSLGCSGVSVGGSGGSSLCESESFPMDFHSFDCARTIERELACAQGIVTAMLLDYSSFRRLSI